MSTLQLLLAPDSNSKPWLNIFANSVTAKSLSATSSMSIASLEVKNNLTVNGYTNSNSDQYTSGLVSLTTNLVTVATPNINGGTFSIFNRPLNKVVVSGVPGTNTAGATVNGGFTWTQLITPFANPIIEYSPELNLYSGLDVNTSVVYTSPSAVNGSWVLGTPYPGPGVFASNSLQYFPAFGRWYTQTSDPTFRVASSVTGSLYGPQASNRIVQNFAYAPSTSVLGIGNGRLVAVGDQGPQYSDDGKTWINSNSAISMADVTYSPFWSKFVAIPRGAVNNFVYSSVNGIDWITTPTTFEVAGNLRTLTWSDQFQLFVAAGDNSRFWISKDGVSWRRLTYAISGGAAAFYGSRFYPEIGNFMFAGISSVVVVSPPLFLA